MASTKFLARYICTGAIRLNSSQVPVHTTSIGGKYAGAIYSAAVKTKNLDSIIKDINSYEAEVKRDAKLRNFIFDPFIHKSEKKKAVFAAAEKVKCSDLTKRFLALIAENGRMEKLDEIFSAFKLLIASHRGELICEVTTAKAMDASMKSTLEKVLQGFGKGEKQLHIKYKIDPSLVAGMTVSIGNQFIDMSAASKIEQYRELLESEL